MRWAERHTPDIGVHRAIQQFAAARNLDLSKPFNVGLPEPLDVSVGIEARRDTYEIKQGDTQSWSNGGLQASSVRLLGRRQA